ncbi:hypothetical protein [Flavobacterium johnsoniae]|uniref:Uncharacterized protein n=1 Tax=Flavobacterium johnsoniae TaxID=986 RepID=A0A1M5UQL0_FLAJO|nr:hypothetical protein [Flavobacterium johnsoniae]SHH65307.1 hypothetical protein SAMN05444388_114101 [Flavobacterium johnsoniae]
MTYGDEYIRTNSKIKGIEKLYACWEFRYSELDLLDGSNLICIASYRTLPKNDHFISAGFYDRIEDFKIEARKITHIIYSFLFIPSSREESGEIIEDVMSWNKKGFLERTR